VVAAAVACGKLGTELNQVIAVVTAAPDSLEEYDTLIPRAAALNGAGDSVSTTILWASLDSVLTVLNDTTGKTVASHTRQTGRLQAHVGNLYSNPIAIRTLAAADTLFAPAGDTVLTDSLHTAPPPDSLSDSLKVQLADTVLGTSVLDSIVPLSGRPVVYAIASATTPNSVTLVSNDTTHARVTVDTVTTNALGIAFVKVRLLGAMLPDSVVVTARARRARGDTVRGSPVTFHVSFQP
jgi:hypothetical protein